MYEAIDDRYRGVGIMWTTLRQRFAALEACGELRACHAAGGVNAGMRGAAAVCPSAWAGAQSGRRYTQPSACHRSRSAQCLRGRTPDPQQVGAVLRRFEPGDGVRVLVGADGTSQVRTSVNPPASGPSLGMSQSELLVAFVDGSGRVVAGTQHLALAQGMPFGELEPGAAQTVVDAALGGNNSTARDRNGQHAAWPIQDARYQVRGAT